MLMKFMGNAQHRLPKQKDRYGKDRPFNHENLDVHRDKTLKRLEEQKMLDASCNRQKESNFLRSEIQPEAHCSTHLLKVSSTSVSPSSHSMSSGRRCRKYLKDAKIVIEEIMNDEEVTIQTSNIIQNQPDPSYWNELTKGEDERCGDGKIVHTELRQDLARDLLVQRQQVYTYRNKLTIDADEQHYDAYLNCSDEHICVAKRMLKVLENPPFNFRLFFPPRQILPGGCELDMKAEIVETRCSGKVITLLSKDNESSPAVHFISHFAKSLDPVSKGNKLIPVIIEDGASIPRILHGMYMIRYDRDNERGFIWEKLAKSLRKNSTEKN